MEINKAVGINMNKVLLIINEILIKDIILELAIILILSIYVILLLKYIKYNMKNKFISYLNIDILFSKFFMLHFLFILTFLFNTVFLYGVLNTNILECLISKYILALIFLLWSTIIYFIDIIVYNYYIRTALDKDNLDVNIKKQIYKPKVDFVWTSIKILISVLFIFYFSIGLYLDIIGFLI